MAPSNPKPSHAAAATSEEFVISRTFDARRDLMWRVWTEPAHLNQWWGPKGLTTVCHQNDLRPGGVFHYSMQAPNGTVMWGKWVYREVTPPERLVYVSSFSDEAGSTTRAPFSQEFPLELLSTLTLTEADGRTTVTVRGMPLNATEEERRFFESMYPSMQQGWGGTFDQLAEHLARQ